MSLVVVRCPACREAARVPVGALQQMVACPLCETPFVAEEEVIVEVLPSRGNSASRRSSEVTSIDTPRSQLRLPHYEEPDSSLTVGSDVPDPEHDPHLPPVAGLPATVLVGFALMPFGIPLLWFIGPMITGFDASLSLAVPVSLAIAAAALCLGVVYTIDWTAATRIKGVLMLVALSYLAAAGLFFQKKDMMKRFFGDSIEWHWVDLSPGKHSVKMPGATTQLNEKLLPNVEIEKGWQAHCTNDREEFIMYSVLVSKSMAQPFDPNDDWFNNVEKHLKDNAGGIQIQPMKLVPYSDGAGKIHPGRRWEFKAIHRNLGFVIRIVQVYVIEGRVYYLAAEGVTLDSSDEEYVKPFFDSFGTN